MTTADRVDPVYRTWAPPVVVADDETYVGKHRHPGGRRLSLLGFFYTARHLARGR
ncbi:MAG: hypothetical protein JWO57_3909 [Pseudonocardiales bacterium]|nr:hypothetical protein [Pseudonocardiales bacterium]